MIGHINLGRSARAKACANEVPVGYDGANQPGIVFSKQFRGSSHNGGLTAYAAVRGIIIFATTVAGEQTLWYCNLHTGNIDDLAHATSSDGSASIFDVSSSARGNYIAFSSTNSFKGDRNGPTQDVFLKFLPQ